MNYPKIDLITSDSSLNQLFKTYKIGFDIIGNRYEFDIHVCMGISKEENPYVDILDILVIYLNGEKKEGDDRSLILKNITTMFGSEWYENIVKEQALKDWEQISFEKKDEETNMDSLLREIESEIDSFDFEDYLDTDIEHDHRGDKGVRIVPTIDGGGIAADLFKQIKDIIENK
jgi:hypothetical protein